MSLYLTSFLAHEHRKALERALRNYLKLTNKDDRRNETRESIYQRRDSSPRH